MTKKDFREWRSIMNYSVPQAARALGIAKSTVNLYEHGKRYDKPRVKVVIPRAIDLACRHLTFLKYGALPEFSGDVQSKRVP